MLHCKLHAVITLGYPVWVCSVHEILLIIRVNAVSSHHILVPK